MFCGALFNSYVILLLGKKKIHLLFGGVSRGVKILELCLIRDFETRSRDEIT